MIKTYHREAEAKINIRIHDVKEQRGNEGNQNSKKTRLPYSPSQNLMNQFHVSYLHHPIHHHEEGLPPMVKQKNKLALKALMCMSN